MALGELGARFGVSKQRMGQIADQLKKRFRERDRRASWVPTCRPTGSAPTTDLRARLLASGRGQCGPAPLWTADWTELAASRV